MKRVGIVLGVLVLMLVAWSYLRQVRQEEPLGEVDEEITVLSPTPFEESWENETADWNIYQSPRFGYTFRYPDSWSWLPYDEANEEVLFGSHSLTNYDTNRITEFMDHGIVDWERFMGDTPAIKVDLSVRRVVIEERDEILGQYVGELEKQVTSNMQIDAVATEQYTIENTMGGMRTDTYVAFPQDDLLVVASVVVFNRSELRMVEESEGWRDLERVFRSFEFE